MPKILRIINRLNLGGPTYNAAYLTKYLEDEFETLLVAGMKDETEASSEYIVEDLGLKPLYIKDMYREINPLKDYPAYKELVKIIREFKPDIVHTHAAKAGAIGRLAAINCNVPIVIHTFHGHVFHSYFHPIKTKIFLEIERYLAKKSTGIIAISKLQKKELIDDFKIATSNKCQIIPLGFNLDRFQLNNDEKRQNFREKYCLKDDEIAIGIIGRLVPIKNHSLFLKAFAKTKEKTAKKIKAIIIGDGEIREKIEEEALKEKLTISSTTSKNADVLFTSWITDIENALPGLDIVALTSLNEGTPVSLIEAQAAQVPIVSTRVGGIEDVVIENETAFLAKNNCVEDFTNKLTELVENEIIRHNMKEKGFEIASSKFAYSRLCNDMRTFYKGLIDEHQNNSKK